MIECPEICYGGAWRKKGVPVEYIRVIRDMYERVRIRVRTVIGDRRTFP